MSIYLEVLLLKKKNSFPRKGNKIFSKDGKEIGEITSGTISPSLKTGIGLGYISKKYQKTDTEVNIESRKGKVMSIVSKPRILP
jgi:Glycine cleavage system T protein (aminomethyltransferase)